MRFLFFLTLLSPPPFSLLAQSDTSGQWVVRAPLPTPRQEVVHAVLNGRVFIPGGLASGGVGSSAVEVFEPSANAWSTASPLPEPLHHVGLAVVNGKLYVLGGYTGSSFSPTNRVYEYDPDSNSWAQKTPMPVARGAHVALPFQGKVYVIGGVQSGLGVTGRTDVFDPTTNSWQNLSTMPTPREHLSGAVIDSLLYVVGGRVGGTNSNILEAYSPATNLWHSKAGMPTARSGLAGASLRGRMYVFGGEIPGVYEHNEEYDPVMDIWRSRAPMPTPRHGIGAAAFADSIFIIGGGPQEGFGVTDVNEAFVPPAITGFEHLPHTLPVMVRMHQNYPNPFNATTIIQYDLPRTAFVRLVVYNLLGQAVRTLVNNSQDAGTHAVIFSGNDLPSGMYIYRIQADRLVTSKRMILLR